MKIVDARGDDSDRKEENGKICCAGLKLWVDVGKFCSTSCSVGKIGIPPEANSHMAYLSSF